MELGESAVASCPVFQLPRVSAAIETEGRRAQWGCRQSLRETQSKAEAEMGSQRGGYDRGRQSQNQMKPNKQEGSTRRQMLACSPYTGIQAHSQMFTSTLMHTHAHVHTCT